MSLLSQEVATALASAIHLYTRKNGSAATRELLAEFLETHHPETLPVASTLLAPAQVAHQEIDAPVLAECLASPLQPVYRGRWADLNNDDSDG